MLKRNVLAVLAAIAPVTLSTISYAAEEGIYVGVSGGQTNVKQNASHYGYSGPYDVKLNDDDTGWKAYVGYDFFPWLGVEGGYIDFGSISRTVFDQKIDVDFSGWDAFAVGRLPVGPVDIFVKAGFIALKSELDVSNSGSSNNNDTEFAFGAGVAYNYENWSVRLEAESFDSSVTKDFYFVSGGVSYTFDF